VHLLSFFILVHKTNLRTVLCSWWVWSRTATLFTDEMIDTMLIDATQFAKNLITIRK
jgi:hypothetical protein